MKSHEFTIVASGLSTMGDDWDDRFFEAGCDDALLSLQRGLFILEFDRDADSLEGAILSACSDVRRAGASLVRIEPDPLVSASDIAERAGITRQSVSLYVTGERGSGFPTPVVGASGSRPMWVWHRVATWLHQAGKLDTPVAEAAETIDRLNRQVPALNATAPADATLVPNQFARMEYYVSKMKPIDKPVFRSGAPSDSNQAGKPFRLRPNQQMV